MSRGGRCPGGTGGVNAAPAPGPLSPTSPASSSAPKRSLLISLLPIRRNTRRGYRFFRATSCAHKRRSPLPLSKRSPPYTKKSVVSSTRRREPPATAAAATAAASATYSTSARVPCSRRLPSSHRLCRHAMPCSSTSYSSTFDRFTYRRK